MTNPVASGGQHARTYFRRRDFEQDRQCTHSIKLRYVRSTIVAVEISTYYVVCVCVCSLRYPTCNVHMSYCRLCPVRSYNIFPHYLINGTIIKKKMNTNCVFWLPLQILSQTILIIRRTQRDIILNVHRYPCNVPVILARLQWNLYFPHRLQKHTQL